MASKCSLHHKSVTVTLCLLYKLLKYICTKDCSDNWVFARTVQVSYKKCFVSLFISNNEMAGTIASKFSGQFQSAQGWF